MPEIILGITLTVLYLFSTFAIFCGGIAAEDSRSAARILLFGGMFMQALAITSAILVY